MSQIQIYSDTNKGCIFFDGSTIEPKFIGTIVANLKPDEDRIVVKRTDRLENDGITFRTLFKRLNPARVQNEAGENLVDDLGYTTLQVIQYINGEANNFQTASAVQLTLDDTPNFTLDATSTTVLIDNGDKHAVNSIKAILGDDGLIDIVSHGGGDITYYENIEPASVLVNSSSVSGGPSDVVNTLNELFTVGAFESVVISDPFSTMVADVAGVDTTVSYLGNGLDPIGDDIYGSTDSNTQNGLLTTETIDQAGEYFTFDIRVEGTIGFGLVHTQDSYDNGYYSGSSTYANPAIFGTVTGANNGWQFSHWFHPTPNGSWNTYGANTSYSMRAGWSNFNGSDEQADWLAGNPIKVRVGIDSNSFISIETLRDGVNWEPHSRSAYPIIEGAEFRLGIKTNDTAARVFSLPKVHLLEPAAPTMYFRYIESPDGNFEYPLFATEEEANYYDLNHSGTVGTGTSHTHTYADDPTNTTWYMPTTGATMTDTAAPSGVTFAGAPVTFTEITSLTDSDLTPTAFSASDITQEEGTAINVAVTPAGATWSTSVTISPNGSGLVYDSGAGLIQGTLTDVGVDTVYTVTVTRANAYGSSVGTFTITATDVAPIATSSTNWTKAIDFSGSNEYLSQPASNVAQALSMGGSANTIPAPSTSNYTVSNTAGRPWAVSTVFRWDGGSSDQYIWSQGGVSNDDIYLKVTSGGQLYFGWGSPGYSNLKQLATLTSEQWFGVYIGFNGTRWSAGNATAANLNDTFDIRVATPTDLSNNNPASSYLTTGTSDWTATGQGMNYKIQGDLTIGGSHNSNYFHGKVASMVITTLKLNTPMPDNDEIKMMITDPVGWVDDYKIGNDYRWNSSNQNFLDFQRGDTGYAFYATNVWLMGDGPSDFYGNGIRNTINNSNSSITRLNFNSMVSNDIETVNISGLT